MKYHIEVTETLQRVVEVEAETAQEAERLVRDKYRDESIVLGAEDCIEVVFGTVGECKPVWDGKN